VAELIHDFAKENGLNSKIVALEKRRPCVLVNVGNPKNIGLLLVGHLDTVPAGDERKWEHPPFSGKNINSRIYGRGAIDTKGGIVSVLASLLILKDNQSMLEDKGVAFIGVPDEESGATGRLGIKYLDDLNLLNGDGAIYVYPDMHQINIGHRGVLRFKVQTEGKSFHTGSIEWQEENQNLNAVAGMAEIFVAIEKIKFPHPFTDGLFNPLRTNITVTQISGGSGPSMVPDSCQGFIDVRLVPSVSKNIVEDKINSVINEIRNKRNPLKISIEKTIDLPPTQISPKSTIIESLLLSSKNKLGYIPELKISGPANESYLLNELGIPTCTFGPVGKGAHGLNEYVETKSLFIAAEIYAEVGLLMSKNTVK
jgi:succinyl-diaminopimelate desuccinylase